MNKVLLLPPMPANAPDVIRGEYDLSMTRLKNLGYEIAEYIVKEPPDDVYNPAVWQMAQMVALLSDVQAISFMSNWETYWGCKMAETIAKKFDIFCFYHKDTAYGRAQAYARGKALKEELTQEKL